MNELEQELRQWLAQQFVTSENIGAVRRRLFVPWSSRWNAIVRDATAERENIYPKGLGDVKGVVTDPFVSPI